MITSDIPVRNRQRDAKVLECIISSYQRDVNMWGLSFATYASTFFILSMINNGDSAIDNITMTIDTDMSIYYNPATNATFAIEIADASRLPFNPIQLISRGLPCSCSNLKCGCCAGINITLIKFDRLACANVTVIPEEFAMDFDLLMDDKQVMTNRLTARNPPPACMPLYFLPVVTFCVRFFDLRVIENKFNACIDFETRIAQWPVFILHFNCLKIGSDGLTWVKNPQSEGVKPLVENITDPEIYDEVNFEMSDEDSHYLHTSTLTPEEEAQIGTLKNENKGRPIIANVNEPEIYDEVNFEMFDGEPNYHRTSTLTPEEEARIGTLKI